MEGLLGGMLVCVVALTVAGGGEAQLRQDFYRQTCPDVERIVRQAVIGKMQETLTPVPSILRLFFHDCFVEGCDASVLISSPGGDAERDAAENLSVSGDGFDAVIKAKQAVEAACPGVVSCADILALAARDVVVLSGGPGFDVELGRRDGRVSSKYRVPGSLPHPSFNLSLLRVIFRRNNLTMIDMIALSGAHTIGFSHCKHFSNRLYSFSSPSQVDPTLNPAYALQLIRACPWNADPSIAVGMDPSTPNRFDNAYFRDLVSGRGLLSSDQALFANPISRPVVSAFAADPQGFADAFTVAMVRLGRTGVKTGEQGEIRGDCSAFN